MNAYYLASTRGFTDRSTIERYPTPLITLESMDGSLRIPLDASDGWIRMPGATGLEMPPYSIVADAVPGVPGAINPDVRVEQRPIFIPVYCGDTTDQRIFRERLDTLYALVDPYGSRTFKVVGQSYRGIREMVVTYVSGLEGVDSPDAMGLTWAKVGLLCTAHDPYAYSRISRTLEFRAAAAEAPFMGTVGGTDAPFPVMLSSGYVIGSGMTITIDSQVPVYPILELVGPMDSFLGTLSPIVRNPDGSTTVLTDNVWSVSIPSGVPGGQTMRLVTDPRFRSIRLDGGLAAGRIARGSTLRPFFPGDNVFDVVAPGGNDNTRIYLTWRNQYRGLW